MKIFHWILAGVFAGLFGTMSAEAGERIDPERMQRAPAVANPDPLDLRITGNWEVWIPGTMQYLTDGRAVYQQYQPGAAMNQLEIAQDGSYRWGGRSGRLEEVRPWHYQSGRRYYRMRHVNGNEYEFYHGDGDRLVVLFGGVGGHAATGTREGGGSQQSAIAATQTLRAGEHVEAEWNGRWFPAQIRKAEAGRYLISYDGYDSSWDEWVAPARIRAGSPGAKAPGTSSPQPSTAPANNSLGVEWRGSSSASVHPNPAPTSGSNPLGVQWQGETRTAAPATVGGDNPLGIAWVTNGPPPAAVPVPLVVPPQPKNPTSPSPVPIPPPAIGQAPLLPAPPTTSPPPPAQPLLPPHPTPTAPPTTGQPSLLVDRWVYQAVAFHSSDGRVDSEHRDIRGALTFKPDGSYEQDLNIGGIVNAIKGRYRIVGDRVTTEYSWRGQPASDEMVTAFSADGRILTLVRNESPIVWYTLRRAE